VVALPLGALEEGGTPVQIVAVDVAGNQSSVTRRLRPDLAPPVLSFQPSTINDEADDLVAFAMDHSPRHAHTGMLAPNAPFDRIAARLLNADATGASLIDQDVFNGTAETIFLTVTVTKPAQVMVSQSFVIGNATTNVIPATCMSCITPPVGVMPYPSPTITIQETTLLFPVKVFELVADAPTAELPCVAPCSPSGNVFTFAIPPRATGGGPPRGFRVMTMIGQVASLRPFDTPHPADPPFADDFIDWFPTVDGLPTRTQLTGIVDRTVVPARTGCVKTSGPMCLRQGTLVPYRALRSASLTFSTTTISRYATAATAALIPALAAPQRIRRSNPLDNWTTSEGPLP
jgi:hypothetical protein